MAYQTLTLQIRVDDKGSIVLDKLSGKVDDISRRARGARGPLEGLNKQFSSLEKTVKAAGAALAAYFSVQALANVSRGFLNAASSMERYQMVLASVLHSQAKAAEYMKWIAQFAATTPYEIPDIVEAVTRLEAYQMEAKKYIQTLGDAAAALGKPIMAAVEMVADAAQGEFERLKEFGLRSVDVAKAAGFESVKAMTSSRENLAKGLDALMRLLAERYSGAMQTLSTSWEGMISNLHDYWTQFQMTVMSSGVFDYLKAWLKALLDWINTLKREGKLDVWAKNVAVKVINAFKIMSKGVVWFYKSILGLKGAFYFVEIAITAIEKMFLSAITKIVSYFSKIPKVGDKFKPVLENLKLSLDVVNESQLEAIKGFDDTAAAIDNVDKVFDSLSKQVDAYMKQTQKTRVENEKLAKQQLKTTKQEEKNIKKIIIPAYKKLLSTGTLTLEGIRKAWTAASKQQIADTANVKEEFARAYKYLLDTGRLRLKQIEGIWGDLEKHNIKITDDIKEGFINAYERLFKAADISIDQIKAIWDSLEKHNLQVTDNIKQATVRRFTEIVTSASTSLEDIMRAWDFMKEHNIQASEELKKATVNRLTEIASATGTTVQTINSIWDFMKEHNIQVNETIKNAYIRANLDILRNANSTADQVREAWERLRQLQLSVIEAFSAGWNYAYSNFKSKTQMIMEFGQTTAENLRQAFSNTFYNAMMGKINSLKGVWNAFCSELKARFFRLVADIAANRIMMFFKCAWAGNPWGRGLIESLLGIDVPFLTFAGGGEVPGIWNGKRGFAGDTVIAALTPGEWVVPRDVAQIPEVKEFLKAITGEAGRVAHNKNIPARMGAQGLAYGGIVHPEIPHFGFFGGLFGGIFGGLKKIVSGISRAISKITKWVSESTLGKIVSGIGLAAAAYMSPALAPAVLKGVAFGAAISALTSGFDLGDILSGALTGGVYGVATAGLGRLWQTPPYKSVALMEKYAAEAASRGPLGGLVANVGRFAKNVKSVVTGIPSTLASLPRRALEAVWSIAKLTPSDVFEQLVSLPRDAILALKDLATKKWEDVVIALRGKATYIYKEGRRILYTPPRVGDLTREAWERFKQIPQSAWDAILELGRKGLEFLRNFNLVSFVADHFGNIISHLRLLLVGAAGGQALSNIGGKLGIGSTQSFLAHAGGLIPALAGGGEVSVIARPYEYVIRPESARSVGYNNLDYINRTGQLPQTGPQTIHLNLEVHVDSASEPVVINKVIPIIRNASKSGMAVIYERAIIREG